jgi:hypothetical protein
MSQICFVGGEKGGVGKSVVARLLAQYWIDNEIPWVGFDADQSHGALLRYYSGYARSISVHRAEDLDAILEVASGEAGVPRGRVLVDLAAQTERALHEWIESTNALDLAKELGIDVLYWNVMDDGKDSVTLLDGLLRRYGDRVRYVVVLNKGRGEDFTLFRSSPAAQRASELGARVIELPALNPPTMRLLDKLDKSFWAAVNHKKDDETQALGLMDRQRVKVWLKRIYASFAEIEQSPRA